MYKKILILTNEFDIHSDAVISKIRENGSDVIRLNSQAFDTNINFEVSNYDSHYMKFYLSIADSEVSFSANDYNTIWFRKPLPIEIESSQKFKMIAKFRKIEYQTFINEFYNLNRLKRWVNSLQANEQASYKLSNLDIAKKIGLAIPKTIVTNSPSRASEFANYFKWNIIVKPFKAAGAILEKVHFSAYANKINKETFITFKETIKYAPTFLQEYIEKELELRVTVVGKDFFTVAIYSQENPLTIYDFRADSPLNLKHKIYNLPLKIKQKLVAFMNHHNLLFATFDIILTPKNEYVFLECNPNGQWLWIEELTSLPIAQTIAKLLVK